MPNEQLLNIMTPGNLCRALRARFVGKPDGAVVGISAEEIHKILGPDAGALVMAQAAEAGLMVTVTQLPPWMYEFALAPAGSA